MWILLFLSTPGTCILGSPQSPLWVQGAERGEAREWRGGEGPWEGLLTSILPQAQHILLLFTPCRLALLSFSVCSFAS